MSQYPSPYSPPPVPPNYGYDFNYYQPQQDVLAPAQRAGMMLYVVGGLILLPSLCCGAMGLALPAIMAQEPSLFSEVSASGMSPEGLQTTLMIAAGVTLLLGVVLIVLGRFVRRGSMGAAVTGSILAVLVFLYLVLNGLGILVMSGKLPPAQMVLGLAMTVLGLVIFGLLIVWLIQAAMAAPRIAMMQSQYQQQYWQYQQQQQMYQPGYVPPPAPPVAPAPLPPPASPNDLPRGDSNGPSA